MRRYTSEALRREGLYGIDDEATKWLEQFIQNYVPFVDIYDDDSWIIDDLKPYAHMIHIAVEEYIRKNKK